MAPFTLAALVLLLVPMFFSGGSGSRPAPEWTGWKAPVTLNAEMYRKHVEFQRTFSLMPLGATPFPASQSYLRYSLAEDGLIDGGSSVETGAFSEIPPFPLEGLIDFLTNYTYTDSGFVPPYGGEFICLLIVLGLCIPLILRDRRGHRMGGKLSGYLDKQVAV
jgi:hypothetical protein